MHFHKSGPSDPPFARGDDSKLLTVVGLGCTVVSL